MKKLAYPAIVFSALWLTSCTVGVGPDGSKFVTVDAKQAVVVGDAAYTAWRSHHAGKGHQPVEGDK